jgi:hypothetical protein
MIQILAYTVTSLFYNRTVVTHMWCYSQANLKSAYLYLPKENSFHDANYCKKL